MAVSASDVTKLYLAYFGRPPDFDGLIYWTSQPNATIASVAALFSASPESQALYGASSLASVIDAIYMNLFNRHAEPAGLTYWETQIATGVFSPAMAAYEILTGARDTVGGNLDLTAVQHKLQVATDWVAHLDTTAEITGYSGDAANASARAFLATVGSSAGSLSAAETGLDAAIAAAVATTNNTALAAAISSPSVAEGNVGDTHQLAFVVTLNHAATAPVTLSYITTTAGTATPGSDFQAASGNVTFAAGETSKVVNVTVFGDILVEGNETVGLQVTGSAIINSGVTAMGTIIDDDLTAQLTTAIDTITVAAGAGVNTVRGVVDGGTPSNSTFSVGDTIHGNGQTIVELDVAVGGTGAFAFMDGVAAVNVVAGVAATIAFNAIKWMDVGSVNLTEGVNGAFVHVTALADAADLSIGTTIGGHLSATYQDGEVVSLLNTGKGGAMYDAANGDATVHLNTNGATGNIAISSTGSDVTIGDVLIDGSAKSASADFIGVAPVGKDLTVGDVNIMVGDSSVNKVTVSGHDIHMGAVSQVVGDGDPLGGPSNSNEHFHAFASGDIAIGDMSQVGGSSVHMDIAITGSGDIGIGDVSQVAGTSGVMSLSVTGSGDITVGTINQLDGSGTNATAQITIQEHGGGAIVVGDVLQAAGNNAFMEVKDTTSGSGDITIGNVTQGVSSTGGHAELRIFASSSSGVGSDVTVGNISEAVVKSGYAMVWITTDGNGDITVGNITETGGAKASDYAWLFANTGGDISAGNISLTVGDSVVSGSHQATVDIETTAGSIAVGDVSVVAGKEGYATITIDNNAGAGGGNVTAGNLTATVGDNITGGGNPFAQIDVYNEGAKGKDVHVGDVTMTLGKTASGSISITNEGFSNKADAGNVTVGAITLNMADKAHISGSHEVLIQNHQTAFTSASWTTKNKVGALTVGDFHAHMGTGAAFTMLVSNDLTGAKGGAVGNLTVGDIHVTADVNSTANIDIVEHNSATGNIGDVHVGSIDVVMNDGGTFTFSVSATATDGNAGNVAIGDVSVDLGVQGVLNFSVDVEGNNVGDVSIGDMHIVLAESATANSDVGWSVTAYTGNIGHLSVGNIDVAVGQNGFWDDAYFFASASNSVTGGHIASMMAGDVSISLAGAAATTTTRAAAANVGFEMSGYANHGGSIGDVTIGDMTVTLGKSATIDYPVYLQFSAGSLGDVHIGMDTVIAHTNAIITNSNAILLTATTGDIGNVSFGGFDVELGVGAVDESQNYIVVSAAAGVIGNVNVGDMKMVLANTTGNTSGAFSLTQTATASNLAASSADMNAWIHAKGGIGDVTFGNLTVVGSYAHSTLAMAVSISTTGAGNIGDVSFGHVSVDMTGQAAVGEIAVNVHALGNIGDVAFGGFEVAGSGTAEIFANVSATGDIGNIDFGGFSAKGAANVITAEANAPSGNVGNVSFGDISAFSSGVIHAHVSASGSAGNVTVGNVDVSTTVSLSVNVGTFDGNVVVGNVTVDGGIFALHFTGAQPTSGETVTVGTVTFEAPASVTIDAGAAGDVHMAGLTLVAGTATTTNIFAVDANLAFGAGIGKLTIDTFKLEGSNAHNWNEFGSVILPALTAMTAAHNGTKLKVGTVDLSGFHASDSSAVLIDVHSVAGNVKVIGTDGNDIITANKGSDTLTGGAGTDQFITQTENQNITTTTAAATAKITTITDFKAGPAFGETLQVDAASGSVVGKYSEKTAADFNTAVTTALAQMTDPVLHSEVVAVQVGADTYVFVDQDGGHNIDEIVKLVGVSINQLNFADLHVV